MSVPADFDGDGKTDVGIYQPATGTWYVLTSSSDFAEMLWQGWGAVGDVPVPATDFDADGRADYVVYRPSTGQWFVKPSAGGIPWSVTFGQSGDVAVQPVVAPGMPAHPEAYVEYYALDAIGSIRAVTGELGTVLRRHDFLPFGEEWAWAPTGGARLFTGQERDAETGLDYFGARYYRQGIGRFLTVDPAARLEQRCITPQLWNRYSYAWNNPLRYVDPDGRWGRDFHYDLTLALGYAAGFSDQNAAAIASANVSTDSGWAHPLVQPFDYHFTTLERRNELFGEFQSTGSVKDYGRWLHAGQDAFTHLAGPLGFLEHAVSGRRDDTSWRFEPASAAAEYTYGALSDRGTTRLLAPSVQPEFVCVPYAVIRGYVNRFLRERDARNKSAILAELMAEVDAYRSRNQ